MPADAPKAADRGRHAASALLRQVSLDAITAITAPAAAPTSAAVPTGCLLTQARAGDAGRGASRCAMDRASRTAASDNVGRLAGVEFGATFPAGASSNDARTVAAIVSML